MLGSTDEQLLMASVPFIPVESQASIMIAYWKHLWKFVYGPVPELTLQTSSWERERQRERGGRGQKRVWSRENKRRGREWERKEIARDKVGENSKNRKRERERERERERWRGGGGGGETWFHRQEEKEARKGPRKETGERKYQTSSEGSDGERERERERERETERDRERKREREREREGEKGREREKERAKLSYLEIRLGDIHCLASWH